MERIEQYRKIVKDNSSFEDRLQYMLGYKIYDIDAEVFHQVFPNYIEGHWFGGSKEAPLFLFKLPISGVDHTYYAFHIDLNRVQEYASVFHEADVMKYEKAILQKGRLQKISRLRQLSGNSH